MNRKMGNRSLKAHEAQVLSLSLPAGSHLVRGPAGPRREMEVVRAMAIADRERAQTGAGTSCVQKETSVLVGGSALARSTAAR